MRFSPRTWSLLSLMLFIAAAYFWLKGNELQEQRHRARPAAMVTNKETAQVDLASSKAFQKPLAKLTTNPTAGAGTGEDPSDRSNPYRLRNTAKHLSELLRDDHGILLANALVDSANPVGLSIPEHLRAKGDPGSFIVQWKGPVDGEFRQHLAEAGAQIISYVPNNAYYVKIDQAGADKLAGLAGVQTVLPFEPYYKLNQDLIAPAVEQQSLADNTLLRLTLLPGTRESAIQDLAALNAPVVAEEDSPFGPQVIVMPTPDSLADLAALPSVQGIELDLSRQLASDLTRVALGISTNTTSSNSYFNLTGSNIWVNFNDIGVDTNHPAIAGRVRVGHPSMVTPATPADPDGHGTFVAALIAGNGTEGPTGTNNPSFGSETNALFIGMAPLSKLLGLPLDSGQDVYPKVEDTYLIDTAARSNYFTFNRTNTLISNNSWVYNTATYDTSAARYDAAVRDAIPGATGSQPLLFVFAAGNGGFGTDEGGGGRPGGIQSPGTAKNVITVGAIEQFRFITNFYVVTNIDTDDSGVSTTNYSTNYPFISATDSSSQVASYSSRGNVGIGIEGDFGRFKPDVVAPGTMVVSARSEGWKVENTVDTNSDVGKAYIALNTNLGKYRFDSGTTFSAADISGMLALVQEYFETQSPNTMRGGLSPALMKALVINGSRSLTELYDIAVRSAANFQGWGLANLPNSLPSYHTNLAGHATVDEKKLRMRYVEQSATNALATGQSRTWHITLTTNASVYPLRMTLVWTDPPGNPNVGVKLVNDLDLIVTNLDGADKVVFYGNDFRTGDDFTHGSNLSQEGQPASDFVNNVENIFIRNPKQFGREFSVTVKARRVNVNSVNNYNAQTGRTNDVVQDYALVLSSEMGSDPSRNIDDGTDKLYFPDLDVWEEFTPPTGLALDARRGLTRITNGLPLLSERVGANASLVGTNGITNQWNFYVFTNVFIPSEFANITNGSNVAFVTFDSPNLAVPRNLEADIDLYVSQDSRLTNLEPSVVAAAFKGVERGGTEMVVFTNAAVGPASIFYVGVKSEDQQGTEFSLIGVSSDLPFDQDQNGKRLLTAVPFSDYIPDGAANRPQANTMIAIGLSDRRVQRIITTNTISHENAGDLVGILRHQGISATLNNHLALNPGTNTIIYNDYDPITGVERHSDGPGSLNDFVGQKITGPWFLHMIDNAPSHTGRVELLTLTIDPLQNQLISGEFVHGSVNANQTLFYPIDIPPGVTNLTFRFSGLTGGGILEASLRRGLLPTTNLFELKTIVNAPGGEFSFPTTNNAPITPGTYFLAVHNLVGFTVDFDLIVFFGYDNSPGNEFHFEGPGPNLLDDATTNSVIDITSDKVVGSAQVSVRMDHPRVADTVLHLVSPQGSRILLAENRGHLDTQGFGMTYQVTNIFGVPSTEVGYTVFTEDTNITDLPIKFALPPFANQARNPGFVFTNGFEGAAAATYNQGQIVDGWTVLTNEVRVITDGAQAFEGTNYLLLGKLTPPQAPVVLDLGSPTATWSQTYGADFSVAKMVDKSTNNNLGWAVSLDFGAPNPNSQTAAFTTAQNLGYPQGTVFKFTFYFMHISPTSGGHNLGRFRLSTTSDPKNTFANGLPRGGDVTANWTPLHLLGYSAQSGANLTELGDESLLASGISPESDMYKVTAYTLQTNITGIRLEALKDSSLPFGGPGRQPSNGNFVVTEMVTTIEPADLPGAITQDIPTTPGNEYEIRFVAANAKTFNDPNGFSNTGNLMINDVTNVFSAGTNWTANSVKFIARSNLTTVTFSSISIPALIDRVEIVETGSRYYLPEESLDLLQNQRAVGEWRLELTDSKTGAAVPLPDVFSWKLDLQYADPLILAEPLQSNRTYPRVVSINQTNRITPGTLFTNQVHYFKVDTCPDTTLATVTLIGSNNIGQVEMFIDRSGIPTGNPETDDYVSLLNTDTPGNTKNGSATFNITTTTPAGAPLQPGKPFFIAVRNIFADATNSYLINIRLDRSSCLPRQSSRISNNQQFFSMLSAAAGPGAPPDSEGELYSVEVAPGTMGFALDVQADGDVAILARQGQPPTTDTYSQIQDIPGSGDEQLVVTSGSTAPLSAGTWYLLVLNKEAYPVTYEVSATIPLPPILNVRIVARRPQVSFQSVSGFSYTLETSTDLKQWSLARAFTGTGSVLTYTPPVTNEKARFYRLIQR
jgi:subtilisin-like proprotein convertase family protein